MQVKIVAHKSIVIVPLKIIRYLPSVSSKLLAIVRLKSVLGEALLVEGKNGSLDPVLLALFRREGSGQMDELGKVRYGTLRQCFL